MSKIWIVLTSWLLNATLVTGQTNYETYNCMACGNFQQLMIDTLENMNLKMDTLQSASINHNRKMEDLDIEIGKMQAEKQDLVAQVNILQNQNEELSTKYETLELKYDILQTDSHAVKPPTMKQFKESKKKNKMIRVSEPQSVELQLQNLIGKVDNNDIKHTNELNSLKQNLQSQIHNVVQYSTPSHGNTYIRWGRTTCPNGNGTDLVYSGYTGGSWYNHYGAATNNLCMPMDPEFLSPGLQTKSGWEGHVYGVEYEDDFNGNHLNHDVPCAVCKSDRTAIIMIPARQHCDSGWTAEYVGFLVSGTYSYPAATEYVCLDSLPESETGTSVDNNGGSFYNVLSKCGSLPCGPYKDDGLLPCVVCTK